MPVTVALLRTKTADHPITLHVANDFSCRFRGLMFRKSLPPGHGMLLTRCTNVHTAFMRFQIDLVYLDEMGVVTGCVPRLKPWRIHLGATGREGASGIGRRASHVLELAAGSIVRLGIDIGDQLRHDGDGAGQGRCVGTDIVRMRAASPGRPQEGAAMAEFVIVGPIVAMLGLSILQYGMLFFAKNQINHAGFMAARAGAMMNADVAAIEDAYLDALIPIYGGGTTAEELSGARQRAREDMTAGPNGRLLKIEMLSPSKESFDDWNDVDLQQTIGNGRRVVPNSELASRDPGIIGERSGQSIQDANLIKLRITHAYEPKVPLTGAMYNRVLRWLDVGGDMDYSRMLRAGRVPLVTHVTLNMHSDAIEPVAPPPVPGLANTGEPRPPGGRPDTTMPAPVCTTAECNIDVPPGIERSKDAGGGDQETGNPEPPACA